jgi:hypothetical protein
MAYQPGKPIGHRRGGRVARHGSCQCLIEQRADRRRLAGGGRWFVSGLGGVKNPPHDLGGRFRWLGMRDCRLQRGEEFLERRSR